MGTLTRTSFDRGWVPSADAVHAPDGALLRMDNFVLDERGVVSLRKGSSKINGSAFADTDVHSLYTAVLSGTRYRMAGATNAVYANGSSIKSGLAGSNDVAFGSYLGQIVFARSTSKWKYDGSTVRTWGIAAPNAAPTLATIAADSKTFASFDSSTTADLTIDEDDTTGKTFVAGHDGTASGALVLNPNATSGRGIVTKSFGGATNFTSYDGGQTGADDDIIELYVYVTEPEYLQTLTLLIDVNDGTFQKDTYGYVFRFESDVPEDVTPLVTGWNRLQVKRGDMVRAFNATSGKDWSTVYAGRITATGRAGTSIAQLRFDAWRIIGGNQRPLTGDQTYYVVAVYNSGTYTAKSAPSAASAAIGTSAQGVTVTIPSSVISALDSQVNELWVYRQNEALGDAYRIGTKTGGPWAGDQTVDDVLSDDDALEVNLVLERTNTTPPDTIIGIAGPHYDRLLCLTASFVYPSQPRNLDSFDSLQPVRVGDASETAYWIARVREEVFVGTSKDIYRFDGDWTEGPDGLINVIKRPMGVAHPPVSSAIAQDGDTLIYLAADGWRVLGSETPITSGDVDLLYRGYTRHGISPVNLTTGRFRAAVANGMLTAITPEGASTTSSTVLHRYQTQLQRWYRHTYSPSWRCVYREPDGTLIASDNAGYVWTLDTGTQDASSDIAVVLWTPADDNDQPNQRKDAWDARVRTNTNGQTATIAVHLDGSGSSSTSFTAAPTDLSPVAANLSSLSPYRQMQFRVTGSFSTFLWYDYTVTYRERPPILVFAEPKPETRGTSRKRFAGLTVTLDTLGGAATVTPVLDDVAQTGLSVTTSDPTSTALTFNSLVGRDLWAKIAKSDGFEYYGLEPNVLATLPPIFKGRTPDNTFGVLGQKVITGLRVRACTLAATRTFTPILDGVTQTGTFTLTTGADEPDDVVYSFSSPQTVTDLAFTVDGNIELYDWQPLIDATLPLGRSLWDSGPIDLGERVAWVTHLELKGQFPADLTITPYVDGTALDAQTLTANNAITTYTVSMARPVRGRQLRFVLSSTSAFYLFWIEPRYRLTGGKSDLQRKRIPVAA